VAAQVLTVDLADSIAEGLILDGQCGDTCVVAVHSERGLNILNAEVHNLSGDGGKTVRQAA
jgi:hypothetical protein